MGTYKEKTARTRAVEPCYKCYLTFTVFIIGLLLLNTLNLVKTIEEIRNKEKETEHVNSELAEELFFINYSLGSTFDLSHARSYIEYDSPKIKELAFELNTPENMYYYVLKNISYVPVPQSVYATDVLRLKEGDCNG